MKKSKILLSLSAFAFAIVGAFASMNSAIPADLYAKVDGQCQLRCASEGVEACAVPAAYQTIQDCEAEQNPVQLRFEPTN
ncbi:hypothetical protein ED312_05745 [Sinomicrobium pectinilyticum]|uniref:DUF3551 domain-containing protein n=1 Tax=Sinomicrobium pectinilyticum TaxID=1084421 RepID=A0A3N0ESL6_SINP1|nr:DUF6520 family protein [Sinomicrobium pectinilyticum]RNL90679.1 hypothetical protein ED312_05745 [Sinomicrobium pectinilyticum]